MKRITKKQIQEARARVRGAQSSLAYNLERSGSRTWTDYTQGYNDRREWTPSPEERIAAMKKAAEWADLLVSRSLHLSDLIAVYAEQMVKDRAEELERIGA